MLKKPDLLIYSPAAFINFLKKENIKKFFFFYDDNQKKLIATPVDTNISNPRMMVACFVRGKKRMVFSVMGIIYF